MGSSVYTSWSTILPQPMQQLIPKNNFKKLHDQLIKLYEIGSKLGNLHVTFIRIADSIAVILTVRTPNHRLSPPKIIFRKDWIFEEGFLRSKRENPRNWGKGSGAAYEIRNERIGGAHDVTNNKFQIKNYTGK